MKEVSVAALSGATQQALARLLDQAATHSLIESLYMRFEVPPLSADTNPNKLRKSTHLVRELNRRTSGGATLMSLVNYVGSESFGVPALRRGAPQSQDFYDSLDRDLGSQPVPEPYPIPLQRQFSRPGTAAPAPSDLTPKSKRYVFVVRGRDSQAYEALAALLIALDLRIVTWDDAVRGAGGGTPTTLDIVKAGIDMANAVVVLMTPDDLGQVKPEFFQTSDVVTESSLRGQARQNVVFEAGWAMALSRETVILVRVGDVRPLSDIDGLNYVALTGDFSSRRALITRLKGSHLEVDDGGEAWRTAGRFPGQA